MKDGKRDITFKKTLSVLSIALFLAVAQGSMNAFAADAPGKPGTAAAAGKAGEEAGKSVSKGMSMGTIGFSIAVVAGTIAVGIATLGGSSTTTTTTHH